MIQQRYGVWDGSRPMKDLGGNGPHSSTIGVARYIEQQTGLNTPAHFGPRDYQALRDFRYDTARAAAIEGSAARANLTCVWYDAGPSEWRYGNTVARRAATGVYDTPLRAALDTFPLGNRRPATTAPIRLYIAFQHEADIGSYDTVNGQRTLIVDKKNYVAGLQHMLMVAVDWALTNGVKPEEFGVGGLLTPVGIENESGWDWAAGLPDWVLGSGFVVGFTDPYYWSKSSTEYELFRPKAEKHVAYYQQFGVERVVIAETALSWAKRGTSVPEPGEDPGYVGNVNLQVKYLTEQRIALRARLVEAILLFHKPDGPASWGGSISEPGREKAAQYAGWIEKEFNRLPQSYVVAGGA